MKTVKKFLMGFVYAWAGIKRALSQRNMKVHIFAACLVILFGFFFQISFVEWVIIIVLIALVFAAEMFNTAIEDEANIMRDQLGAPYSLMGKAKDLAAGAVLILAVAAAIIGLAIFLPRVWKFLQQTLI